MEMFVSFGIGAPFVGLEELEALVSDIKILSKKEIKHNEHLMRMTGNPKVAERRIYAGFRRIPDGGVGVHYFVEDYVLEGDRSEVTLVGRGEYSSTDLRKA